MTNGNLISALRNMVDDIENLGAAPMTVDVTVLRQAIAALTLPEGYVLVPVETLFDLVDDAESHVRATEFRPARLVHKLRSVAEAKILLAARPEVK